MYTYDVFISFSSLDEKLVHPIWQRLVGSGLRVFFSDETLKSSLSKPFLEELQQAIVSSKNFLLLASRNALASEYVNQEYQAFYTECFIKNKKERPLVILPLNSYDVSKLPVFLKNLQCANSLEQVIEFFGGFNPEKLKQKILNLEAENKRLTLQVVSLEEKNRSLQNQTTTTIPVAESLPNADNNQLEKEEVPVLRAELESLRRQPGKKDSSGQPPEPGKPVESGQATASELNLQALDFLATYTATTQVSEAIDECIQKMPLNLSAHGWSSNYESITAGPAHGLNQKLKGEEIHELMARIYQYTEIPLNIWKYLLLLRHCTLRPGNRDKVSQVLVLMAHFMQNLLLKPVMDTALKLVNDLPLPCGPKWQCLYTTLKTIPPDTTDMLIGYLTNITPVDERTATATLVIETMQSSNNAVLYDKGLNLLERFNYRQALPFLRELIRYAPASTTNKIATILGNWNDIESAPLILEALERTSEATVSNYLYALKKLNYSAAKESLLALIENSPENKAQAIDRFLISWDI